MAFVPVLKAAIVSVPKAVGNLIVNETVGKLEDELFVWNRRLSSRPHPILGGSGIVTNPFANGVSDPDDDKTK